MTDLVVYPGPPFWDSVRAELARTSASSVEVFERDELPWILARFSMSWSTLDPLVDELADARFADFVAVAGYRYAVVGYQWGAPIGVGRGAGRGLARLGAGLCRGARQLEWGRGRGRGSSRPSGGR